MYTIVETSEGFVIQGPWSEELHARVKRAKGAWIPAPAKHWLLVGVDKKKVEKMVAAAVAAITKAAEEKKAAERAKEAAEVAVALPYEDNDLARARGGRWSTSSKRWIVPSRKVADEILALSAQREAERKAAKEAAPARVAVKRAPTFEVKELFFADSLPSTGVAVKCGDKFVVIESFGKRFRFDYEAFGCWHPERDGDWCCYGYGRAATDEEIAAWHAAAAAKKARLAAKDELLAIALDFPSDGQRPAEASPEGEVIELETRNIYGGGSWFVLGQHEIWHVRNNAGDGDDWSRNNVVTGGAGGIGAFVPHSDELAARIRAAAAVIGGGK